MARLKAKDWYYTMSEAAKLMGVTRQTIARWIEEGKFESEKIGREVLIYKEDLTQFEDERIIELIKKNIIRKVIQEWTFELQGDMEATMEFIETRPNNVFVFSVQSKEYIDVMRKVKKMQLGDRIEVTYQFDKANVDIEQNTIAVKIKRMTVAGVDWNVEAIKKGKWL